MANTLDTSKLNLMAVETPTDVATSKLLMMAAETPANVATAKLMMYVISFPTSAARRRPGQARGFPIILQPSH